MSFEDEHRAVILLISADRYTALHQWLQELLSSQTTAAEIKLIDLSGEFNVDYGELTANNNCVIHNFNHATILERLWEQLNPHATEWWQLLNIANKRDAENTLAITPETVATIAIAMVIQEPHSPKTGRAAAAKA